MHIKVHLLSSLSCRVLVSVVSGLTIFPVRSSTQTMPSSHSLLMVCAIHLKIRMV